MATYERTGKWNILWRITKKIIHFPLKWKFDFNDFSYYIVSKFDKFMIVNIPNFIIFIKSINLIVYLLWKINIKKDIGEFIAKNGQQAIKTKFPF